MTGPIAFDPLPVPSRQSLVNIPPGAAAQATTLDGDFAKVNTYLQAQPLVSAPAFSRNLKPYSAYLARNYYTFTADVWPGFSTTLPEADAYLLYVGGEALFPGSYVGLVPYLSGPAVVNGPVRIGGVWLSNRSYVTGGMSTILPRSFFNPGQRLDAAPQLWVDYSQNVYIDLCEFGIVGLA